VTASPYGHIPGIASRIRSEADARLIAAAPDLLAVCKAYVTRCQELAGWQGKEVLKQAISIIDRATNDE